MEQGMGRGGHCTIPLLDIIRCMFTASRGGGKGIWGRTVLKNRARFLALMSPEFFFFALLLMLYGVFLLEKDGRIIE